MGCCKFCTFTALTERSEEFHSPLVSTEAAVGAALKTLHNVSQQLVLLFKVKQVTLVPVLNFSQENLRFIL